MYQSLCPCGSNSHYTTCCAPLISGEKIATSPEQLMRSRYSAYTVANIDYIIKTMRGPALEGFDAKDAKVWAESICWKQLKIINTSNHCVAFKAYYEQQGELHCLCEVSRFEYIDGQWFYTATAKATSLNGRCPCGSKKKYKRCCFLT